MRNYVLSVLLVGLTVGLAAVSVHFVQGPEAVDAGTVLVLRGKLAGLGEGDVTIAISAAGIADVECENAGGNVAPGQDTTISAAGSVTLAAGKNGNLVFSVATVEPTLPSSACPNPGWTAHAVDVAFGAGTVTVMQGGVVVLQQAF